MADEETQVRVPEELIAKCREAFSYMNNLKAASLVTSILQWALDEKEKQKK